MRVYILTPSRQGISAGFDQVEYQLIRPALAALEFETQEMGGAGANLEAEVIEQLVTADVVIADVSYNAPNVQLELGIRYALRRQHTILISAQEGGEVSWHLRNIRRLIYDSQEPAAALAELVTWLRQLKVTDTIDSPVFKALPKLKPPSEEMLPSVPRSLEEELSRAIEGRDAGHLALLASEVRGFSWRLEGLRRVAQAQYRIRDKEGARDSFRAIVEAIPDDTDANTKLAVLYQRLGLPRDSTAAIQQALKSAQTSNQRAELLSLHATNMKAEWTEAWRPQSDPAIHALRSPLLVKSRDTYMQAFLEDLNHHYAGLNALVLTKIRAGLGEQNPEIWGELFDDDEQAASALREEQQLIGRLIGASELVIQAASKRGEGRDNPWLAISEADVAFLSAASARRAARLYLDALGNTDPFVVDAVREQLSVYESLGLFKERLEVVLATIGPLKRTEPLTPRATVPTIERVIVFTGHMIDRPGRPTPRFPAGKEEEARAAIEQAVRSKVLDNERTLGLASGTSGGDLLFHEVCRDLGVRTELFLVTPEPEHVAATVTPSGPEWVDRYYSVRRGARLHVLQASSSQLPAWLAKREGYSVWHRHNRWLLQSALAYRESRVTLVALWNGAESDGPGGTREMINDARAADVDVIVLNTDTLFGLR